LNASWSTINGLFIGPTGAGKTSAYNLLTGSHNPVGDGFEPETTVSASAVITSDPELKVHDTVGLFERATGRDANDLILRMTAVTMVDVIVVFTKKTDLYDPQKSKILKELIKKIRSTYKSLSNTNIDVPVVAVFIKCEKASYQTRSKLSDFARKDLDASQICFFPKVCAYCGRIF
jgi:hypothetical protein